MTPRLAGSITEGWIEVPYPAEPCGCFQIKTSATSGGYTTFHLADRDFPYTIGSLTELRWSRSRPDGA